MVFLALWGMEMRVETVTCGYCGFVLTLEFRDVSPKWAYDAEEWRSRCKQPNLGDPCWCVLYAARERNRGDARYVHEGN